MIFLFYPFHDAFARVDRFTRTQQEEIRPFTLQELSGALDLRFEYESDQEKGLGGESFNQKDTRFEERLDLKGRGSIYHLNLLGLAYEMAFGPQAKTRPEAHIFGHSQLITGWTVMDRISEIQVPTLVLAGRYDFLYPPEQQAILADRLPNAQLELIERAGHNPQMERSAEVNKKIKSFVAEVNPVYA